MGWRERDYAKWTKEERRRFLGSATPAASSPGRAWSSGRVFRAGSGFAIAASITLLALGQLPRGHPLLATFHLRLPDLHEVAHKQPAIPTVTRIALPRAAAVGSFLTLHGQLPAGESGTVSVEGAFVRPPWQLL